MKKAGYPNRYSGIEIYKIFAMIFIIFSHVLPAEGGWSPIQLSASNSLSTVILCMMLYGGPLGVQIYTICSAWFLLENNRTKLDKVLSLLMTSFVVSIAFLIIGLLSGYAMPKSYIIKQIFPFIFGNKWFFNGYIILYLIHPLLNKIVDYLRQEQKKYMLFLFFLLVLYGVLSFIDVDAVFYNRLIGMVCIYFVTGFFKYHFYNKLTTLYSICISLISCIIIILEIVASNAVGLKIPSLNHMLVRWAEIANPVLLVFAISTFYIFEGFRIKNKAINGISSLSILVYLIHGNRVFIDYILPQIHVVLVQFIKIGGGVLGHVLLLGILIIFCAYIIAYIVSLITNRAIQIVVDAIMITLQKKLH